MSKTFCPYPIVGAIARADDFLGPNRTWHAVPEGEPNFAEHHRFLGNCLVPLRDYVNIPEMEAIASESNEDINRFLKERKFDITLDPFEPGNFGTASMLDVIVKWLEPGTRTDIVVGDASYPAVNLEEGVQIVETAPFGLVATIETIGGDIIGMAPLAQGLPASMPDDMALMDAIVGLDFSRRVYDFSGTIFPMVDLAAKPDISWLEGLWTRSEGEKYYKIAKALQQTFFKMNEFGARTKSAAAMEFELLGAKAPPFIVDRPFLLWKVRPGFPTPFFAAYITTEDWKDPGSLDDM